MFRNFLKDVRFRRCRKAAHGGGCRSIAVALGNEFGGIQIIGAEIVPPFGQAVCFVEYPAVDLAVFDGFDKARIAELFGCDKQNADIAQSDPVQYVRALRYRQHAVERIHIRPPFRL